MDRIVIKNSSAFAHFQNAEHYNFGVDIVEGIATDIVQVADALPSYNLYKTRVENEGVIFKLSPESEETAKITSLNKGRIACWKFMTRTLDYYADYGEGGQQEAGKHLNHVLKTYKNLTEANLFAKTGYLRDLIDALKESSAQTALNLIPGLLPLADKLEELNTELDGLYIKREQDRGFVRDLGTLSDYRPQVDKAFFDLVEDLNSAYRRNELGAKNPAIKAAFVKIAITITSLYNKLLEILGHRNATGKKKPQKPDITNPEVPGGGSEGGDGEGGDGGDGEGGDGEGGDGEGGTENPDIENPPPPPFLPDFE
ncbi:hypothetical protein FACS1894181_10320 [Bacteroidia bacterium]|nr:hypothetical protein FACS189438_2540 [Bacteroidia bacterium]GHV50148.1 hypothetical protein FACS1894181_10320 [Bacteroidia bacterium]